MGILLRRGIIEDVSIRRTIESLLADEQQQEAFRASPETYFAEHGIEDIPGELIGTAFVHYSDTAPIEHGDAVAGIATHYSPVPFEAEDLPDLALTDGEESDPFASLGLLADEGSEPSHQPHDDDEAPPQTDDVRDDTGPQAADHGNTEDDSHPDDADLDDTDLEESASSEASLEPGVEERATTTDDGVDSASFHDHQFDDGFDDGFDAAEALEKNDESGFGDGVGIDSGPSEILGEIHGGGPLDPELDDPFFEEVTDDGLPTVHLEFEPIDFEPADLEQHLDSPMDGSMGHDIGHDSFTDHGVEVYDDVDPSDLDLDDF